MKSCVVFVVVKGVPGYEGYIPLIQEKNKPEPRLWKLIGGTRENFESLENTASREVKEEIGIDIVVDDIIYEKVEGRCSYAR